MKLTVTFSSRQKSYQRSFSVRTLVSLTVLSSLFMLVSSRSTESVSEDLARIRLAQSHTNNAKNEVDVVRAETATKLHTLMARVAAMSATVKQLDNQGKRLAEELGMTAAELDAFVPDISTDIADDEPLLARIDVLQQSLDVKARQLSMLESLVRGHHINAESQLSGRPVDSGWLSSYYGMRADPFTGEQAMHKGLDFAGEAGADVLATAAGIVTWAGERYGYGQLIEIEHGDGLVTRYGHNQTLNVKVGDVVTRGQVIASMGNTGRSTGAHVHYEVIRNGQQVDPLPYVYQR
ncbi:M23 family metallopeptidase [Alteromonas sp. CYL-A6]|uniref:M23 family metallopeptidase n=1 Tax=Alteromonas nitratireducens TaxID=3390813 RepID=UPI0034BE614D